MKKDRVTAKLINNDDKKPNEKLNLLRNIFGYEKFRESQENIIDSILNGQDTVTIMPTGGGKSICYQIPAILSKGTAIVVSPLISLMKDQVDTLKSKGVSAGLINSTITQSEYQSIVAELRNNKLKLLYIAPERLESEKFLQFLAKIKISFIAIDEAHCISEWGHDFRPSYKKINRIFEYVDRVPIIALTATATKLVKSDIIQSLSLTNQNEFITGFDRKNLYYDVINTKNKELEILKLIEEVNFEYGEKSKYKGDYSIIIYCGSRKKVEELNEYLFTKKIESLVYHAGLEDSFRAKLQDKFINGTAKIIIATNAFGMGIDKSNVRLVIHYDLPSSIENYYQESGRAGRDNKNSKCVLLYTVDDRYLQEFFIEMANPKLQEIEDCYRVLLNILYKNELELDFKALVNKIAANSNLKTKVIESAINILQRFDVLTYKLSVTKTLIRLKSSANEFMEVLQNIDKNEKYIIESLLRYLPSNSFDTYVELEKNYFLRKYNIKEIDLNRAFNRLKYFNLISLEEKGNLVFQINKKLNFEDENLNQTFDYNEVVLRRKYSREKLDFLQEYAETQLCKRNFILSYFNDEIYDKKSRCNNCSSCQKSSYAESFFSTQRRRLRVVLIKEMAYWNMEIIKKNQSELVDYIFELSKNGDLDLEFLYYKTKRFLNIVISDLIDNKYLYEAYNKKHYLTNISYYKDKS